MYENAARVGFLLDGPGAGEQFVVTETEPPHVYVREGVEYHRTFTRHYGLPGNPTGAFFYGYACDRKALDRTRLTMLSTLALQRFMLAREAA